MRNRRFTTIVNLQFLQSSCKFTPHWRTDLLGCRSGGSPFRDGGSADVAIAA